MGSCTESIVVRDATRDDLAFLRKALADLNAEMQALATVTEPGAPIGLNLYVVPPARRRGIASKLLEAAEHTCRALGAVGIGLGFLEGNHAAEAAYRKAGYLPTRHAMWLRLD